MPKIIMLAGAPQASHKWQEEDLTVTVLLPPFEQYIEEPGDTAASVVPSTHLAYGPTLIRSQPPRWRPLPLLNEDLPAGLTLNLRDDERADFSSPQPSPSSQDEPDEDDGYAGEGISFLTATSTSFAPTPTANRNELSDREELTQFLEQSFALHDDPYAASQPTHPVRTPPFNHHDPYTSTTYDISTTSPNPPTTTPNPPSPPPLPHLPNLTTLSSLPKPHILKMHPHPPTISLITGIISLSAPRTVIIRRTGIAVSLLEVLVGDDTKAGFRVTFWLGPGEHDGVVGARRNAPDPQADELREQALSLRPGMVVAVRNIALRVFRDVVSGQSLGRRGGWGGTGIVVLGEGALTTVQGTGRAGGAGMEERVRRRVEAVREWTGRFVRPVGGVGDCVVRREVGRGKKGRFESLVASEMELPEDETQEFLV